MKSNILISSFLLLINLTSYANITIIHNVKGNTINQNKHTTFSAIAIESGKVLNIGNLEELSKSHPDARFIDGKGKSMLPGLHDAHAHIMGYSRLQSEVNLAGDTSLEQSLKKVKDYADSNPDKQWILGRGWNQVLWEGKKFPNKSDLDSLNINKPIFLRRVDGHAGWANSIAMEITGTIGYEKDIPGGEILLDQNGLQTGIFVDNAMGLISNKIEEEDAFDTIDFMINGLKKLASIGLTSVDDAGISYQTYNAYKLLAKHKLMPIRINAMAHSSDENIQKMLEKPINTEDDFLQVHSIKYVFDGALGSRGALMIEPYSDRADTKGLLVQTQDFVQKMIYANAKNGWQAAIHAIGDNANRMALNALSDKRALSKSNRNRVEHAQIINMEDISIFSKQHIIASMQPTHATSDKNMAEDRVGKERLKGAYAWNTLSEDGVMIASGSDFPVELANPFFGIHAAVTRQDRDNQPLSGWIPSERLTLEQTLASFTINAAFTNRKDDKLGSLEPGKWADFILVDQNIFTIDKKDIWKTQVLQTWVAGKKIFDRALEK
jgi:predicted amidohydrolase YtcJ